MSNKTMKKEEEEEEEEEEETAHNFGPHRLHDRVRARFACFASKTTLQKTGPVFVF